MGAVWTSVGTLLVLATVLSVFGRAQFQRFLVSGLPQVEAALTPVLGQAPSMLLFLAGLVAAAFSVFFGLGLLTLRSWARTVGVACNIAAGVCLAALTAMVAARLPGQPLAPATVAAVLLGAVSAAALIAFGFLLGASTALAVYLGATPALPRPAPARCPTCGGNLDLNLARCPRCDAGADHPTQPKRARLVESGGGKEYPVSLRKLNRVGHGTPGLEIALDHRSVSGHHADIEYHDGRFYLHAQDETQGTAVNQRPVRESEIRNNDVITFGQAEYRFVVDA